MGCYWELFWGALGVPGRIFWCLGPGLVLHDQEAWANKQRGLSIYLIGPPDERAENLAGKWTGAIFWIVISKITYKHGF